MTLEHPAQNSARRSPSPPSLPFQNGRPQASLPSEARTNDAVAEIQQQIRLITRDIEEQRAHLRQLNQACHNMHADIGSIWHHFDAIKEKVAARLDGPGRVLTHSDVDILVSQLQSGSAKKQDLDRINMELGHLTRSVRRLTEGRTAQEPDPPVVAREDPSTLLPRVPHSEPYVGQDQEQPIPDAPFKLKPRSRTPPARPYESIPGTTGWRLASSAPVAIAPQPVETSRGSSWTAVNSIKRPAEWEPSHHYREPEPASDKRQKFAPLMPRVESGVQPMLPLPGALRQQATAPADDHSARQFMSYPQGAAFVGNEDRRPAAATQGYNAHPSERPEKSMIKAEPDRHMQDWATTQHAANVANKHHFSHPCSPHDSVTSSFRPAAAQPCSPPGSQPQLHQPPGVSRSPIPYSRVEASSSAKKSRTKPIRNADGVLIRKDGRPDMRSISSAQNLRKVHAKKEAERNGGGSGGGSYDDTDDEGSVVVPPSLPPSITPVKRGKQQRSVDGSAASDSAGLSTETSPTATIGRGGDLPSPTAIATASPPANTAVSMKTQQDGEGTASAAVAAVTGNGAAIPAINQVGRPEQEQIGASAGGAKAAKVDAVAAAA